MKQKKTKLTPKNIDKQLCTRLFFVGGILIVFSLSALTYGSVAPSEEAPLFSETRPLASGIEDLNISGALSAEERFRIYAASFVFAAVGSLCIYIAWRKRA